LSFHDDLAIGSLPQLSPLSRLVGYFCRAGLVPQDPTDEPADKLLERIKAEKAKREAETKAKKKRKQPGKSQQLELF
jgi:hypothetical protein